MPLLRAVAPQVLGPYLADNFQLWDAYGIAVHVSAPVSPCADASMEWWILCLYIFGLPAALAVARCMLAVYLPRSAYLPLRAKNVARACYSLKPYFLYAAALLPYTCFDPNQPASLGMSTAFSVTCTPSLALPCVQAGSSKDAGKGSQHSGWLRTAESDMIPCMGSKDCMLDILSMHQAGGGTNASVECRMLDYGISLDKAAAFCNWITTTAGTMDTNAGTGMSAGAVATGSGGTLGNGGTRGQGAEAASEGMVVMLFDAQGKASDVWMFSDLPIAVAQKMA